MSVGGARPLIIIGGPLGSGKTTGVAYILQRFGYAKPHVIVNDLGGPIQELDDAALPDGALITILSGGCACCELKEDLLSILCDLIEAPHREMDSIILEMSGAADLSQFLETFVEHPKLKHHLKLESFIFYVDGTSPFNTQESTQQALLILADECIISKVDLVERVQTASIVQLAKMTNPTLQIFTQEQEGKSFKFIEWSQDIGNKVPSIVDRLARSTEPHNLPMVQNLSLPESVSWLALTTWMTALLYEWGDRIQRVKASLVTPRGSVLIHGVRHTVFPPELMTIISGAVDDGLSCGTLVLIGRDFDQNAILESLQCTVDQGIRQRSNSHFTQINK